MKVMLWDRLKNEKLRRERQVSFEEVAACIQNGGLLDIVDHPRQDKYPGQKLLVVALRGYACLVPFAEAEDHFFLKTVIPSRKATRQYLDKESNDES